MGQKLMKLFRCACGAQVFFDNTLCLACKRELGFIPESFELATLDDANPSPWRKCHNYSHEGVCNWLVETSATEELCQACRLNHVIPDLSQPQNRTRWLEVEKAKRRLIYSLNRLALPVTPKSVDYQKGLSFDILASAGGAYVLTGHSDGLITLNLDEADVVRREETRLAMKERYRTLLGHFRHEIGHYYWDRVVDGTPELADFRAMFGDERANYEEALQAYYARETPINFSDYAISSYATAHPWEDFAESFAHYLHMIDTLETAQQFGFVSEESYSCQNSTVFELLMGEWMKLTVALNSLNRSMGLPDAYPFAISERVSGKLRFIHELIQRCRTEAQERAERAA
ncbi:MAG: hypothetical protein RJA70_1265 [Pseudomonadota bacterium]|jgi:hypothetical protein